MKRSVLSATALALLLASALPAAAKPKASKAGSDERAIRAMVASFVAAFNRGDAETLAAQWLPDGDVVTASGEMIKGREAIQRQFERVLAERGHPKLSSKILAIRFLGPDVAVEDSTSKLNPEPPGPPAHMHHTTVYVKRDGKWRIASARGAISFPPSNYDRLKELEWMVGTWDYQSESGTEHVQTTCRWSDNKNYLLREICAELDGQVCSSGHVRIGWDPASGKIKSWIFQSDGGVFEGTWSRDGNRWLLKESGTLRDGTPTTAVNILTPVDADSFQFQSVKRTLGGKPEADTEPITLHRKRGRP